jgi:N-acetylmuramoyl-L-alanine amidase
VCRIFRYSLAALVALTLVGCNKQDHRVVERLPQPFYIEPDFRVEKPPAPPPPAPPPKPTPPPSLPTLVGKKVVIDAGHGGKDPGTLGPPGFSRLSEKTIVLLVANEVARLLRDRGATVISTRTTDRFLELDDRAAIAQRNRADLFVSVHADSASRRGACGSTVYIGRSVSSQSSSAAWYIKRALSLAGIECRGVQRANYRVLVAHSRPAVLVECGFLTNAGDASRLNTQAYRSKIAAAIARGVADYLCR